MSAQRPDEVGTVPAAPAAPSGERRGSPAWWWAHAGRISGGILGLLVLAVLALLAAAGYAPAGALIALVVGGLLMIIVGGRIGGR